MALRLHLLRPLLAADGTFVKPTDVAATSLFRVTARDKRIAESPKGEELSIEEIV